MNLSIFRAFLVAVAIGQPAWANDAEAPNTQTISYELRHSTSKSTATGRNRERLTHVLRYSKLLSDRSKGFFYLSTSSLDATNPFGRSDATLKGGGLGLTFQTGGFTTATVALSFNDNAEVFNPGGGPTTSSGNAQTLVFGMQRLFGYGPRSYLTGSITHAVTRLKQDFGGGPTIDTRHITTLSGIYAHQIGQQTLLNVGGRAVFSNDAFTSHLVKQANYATLGIAHRMEYVTVSVQGSAGIGAVAGDRQVSFKIGYDF
ncbi:hypothetical protein [Pseudooceanicola sp. MF1-13]|uniref:hypothetical protein n=1 Tax=Pseudooceanicola sp. MF1-13 TaxID=3379095 RepID=UPI00389220BB